MAHVEIEARPRYQRSPRQVHPRRSTTASYHSHDLLGALLALACCVAIVWGFGFAYQIGYSAAESHYAQEVSSRA